MSEIEDAFQCVVKDVDAHSQTANHWAIGPAMPICSHATFLFMMKCGVRQCCFAAGAVGWLRSHNG